jgi:hypothetical protein
MLLSNQHREALLGELNKAKEDKALRELCMKERKDDHLKEWWEIHIFLADERIKLIEKSLIENEIDY